MVAAEQLVELLAVLALVEPKAAPVPIELTVALVLVKLMAAQISAGSLAALVPLELSVETTAHLSPCCPVSVALLDHPLAVQWLAVALSDYYFVGSYFPGLPHHLTLGLRSRP